MEIYKTTQKWAKFGCASFVVTSEKDHIYAAFGLKKIKITNIQHISYTPHPFPHDKRIINFT